MRPHWFFVYPILTWQPSARLKPKASCQIPDYVTVGGCKILVRVLTNDEVFFADFLETFCGILFGIIIEFNSIFNGSSMMLHWQVQVWLSLYFTSHMISLKCSLSIFLISYNVSFLFSCKLFFKFCSALSFLFFFKSFAFCHIYLLFF